MKRALLLQHWHGPIGPLEVASRQSIGRYAAMIGADYRWISGKPMGEEWSPQLQKLVMLSKQWDRYEVVVMIDADMFMRRGCTDSILEDRGIGVCQETQHRLRMILEARHPGICNQRWDYYGGAIYRLEAEWRHRFRKQARAHIMQLFNKGFGDEGVMHAAATAQQIRGQGLTRGEHWAMSSYDPKVETAALIHVRSKVREDAPRTSKRESYLDLLARGLIDPCAA